MNKKIFAFPLVVFIILSGLVILGYTFAASEETTQVTIQDQDKVSLVLHRNDTSLYPTNFLNVSVIGKEGKIIEGLKQENFQVFEDGKNGRKEQKVIKVVRSEEKGATLYIVLVIDCSASMVPAMEDTKKAAETFLTYLSSQDKVAILSFWSLWKLNCDFTTDREALKSAINEIQPGGGTALYASINHAISMFEKLEEAKDANKAVIALTDGKNNGPGTVKDVIEVSHKLGVPVFTIGLHNATEGIDTASLMQIANQTGGIYKEAPQPSDLEEIYKVMAQLLKKQYWVEYVASPEHWPNTLVNVSIKVRGVPGAEGLESSLSYVVPVQWWKMITFYVIIEIVLVILIYFLFRLMWKKMGMDPVFATQLSIGILMLLTVAWYVLLFIRIVPLQYFYYFILIGVGQLLLLLIPIKLMAK